MRGEPPFSASNPAIGGVSHRVLQADRPEEVTAQILKALQYVPAEHVIVSSDCGFGRQGCNHEIAFYKTSGIARRQHPCGANAIVKRICEVSLRRSVEVAITRLCQSVDRTGELGASPATRIDRRIIGRECRRFVLNYSWDRRCPVFGVYSR